MIKAYCDNCPCESCVDIRTVYTLIFDSNDKVTVVHGREAAEALILQLAEKGELPLTVTADKGKPTERIVTPIYSVSLKGQ